MRLNLFASHANKFLSDYKIETCVTLFLWPTHYVNVLNLNFITAVVHHVKWKVVTMIFIYVLISCFSESAGEGIYKLREENVNGYVQSKSALSMQVFFLLEENAKQTINYFRGMRLFL